MARAAAPLLLAASLCGCATALSTFDTARTTPVDHVRVSAAAGVYLPASQAVRALQQGKDVLAAVRARGGAPTEEELARLADASASLALQPPAAVQELMLRTGISGRIDAGVRLSTTSLRLDGKVNLLRSADDARHVSIGVGASTHFFSGPVFEVLELVRIDDFSRWDLDVPLLATFEYGESFAVTVGGKYVLSRFRFSQKLYDAQDEAAQEASTPVLTDRLVQPMHFFGGLVSVQAGYRWAFVFLELTAGWTRLRPRLYSLATRRVETRELSGVTIYPAGGVVLRF